MRSVKASKREAPSVAGTRFGSRPCDSQSRSSEEDLILLNTLKLLGCPDALQSWPEFIPIKLDLQRSMFAAPNRSATETILFYLLSLLLGRETIKKEFKDVWPTASQSHMREYRSRCLELMKQNGTKWSLSSESQQLLPALLQRHCGQKLVRLLCELSLAAMGHRLSSLQGHVTSNVTDARSTVSTDLHPVMIRVGRAQIAKEQKKFLSLVVDAKTHLERMRSTASVMIKTHGSLVDREDAYRRQLTDLKDAIPRSSTASQGMTHWKEIFSTVDRIEAVSGLLDRLIDAESHPCTISGERLLGIMPQCRVQRISKGSESTTDVDSSLFGMESAVSLGLHGSTEVDVLSMAWSWSKFGIGEAVESLKPLANQPRKTFVRELMDDASLPDTIVRMRDQHVRSVTKLKEMKRGIIRDVEKLDSELEAAQRILETKEEEEGLRTVLSLLET